MSELYDIEDRADRLDLITRLGNSPQAKAAHREVVEQKREYEANLGHTLMSVDAPVNQREIDYKRGFWRGMLFAYTLFLQNSGPQLAKLLEKELEGRENT